MREKISITTLKNLNLPKRTLPAPIKKVVKLAQAKKGEQIIVLELKELTSFTDYFIIMHGQSERQILAIYEHIETELKKINLRPLGVEGVSHAEWVLMDYGDFIVHIFSRQAREYYSLEKLWGDAPRAVWK
ncbi:MAG: ribosome silencing factor [Candidatus Aminicenantes bacterium]|nr:ribosome silencing factor [Candidatus Aminicenantes bacterium]